MRKFLNLQLNKETRLLPLFFNESLRGVAISLLTTFSTIFIYKILYFLTGKEKVTILLVFSYFLADYTFKFISTLLAENLSLRIGLKKQIYLGELFLALCLGVLFFVSKNPWLLIFTSPLMGLSAGFYWFGRHGLMAKIGQKGSYGKELGMAEVIRIVLVLGTPLLGGAIINWLGYQALFLLSLVFIGLSTLALLKLKEEITHYDTSLKEVFHLFREHKKTFFAYLGNSGAGTVYSLVLPLYIFLILRNEFYLGGFFSLSMILAAAVNFFVGSWVDYKGKKGLLTFGSVISSIVWWGRLLSKNPGSLLVLDVIDRLTGGMTGIPLSVLSYEKAIDGRSTGRAILFRELAISLGSVFTCLLILIFVLIGLELRFTFLLAAFLSLFPLLIVRSTSVGKIND